ncbi:MAG: RHS repeat protein [Phycisphaerales bacterium]|nr:RHS repeat protein [Phycisphaerales bacterium]
MTMVRSDFFVSSTVAPDSPLPRTPRLLHRERRGVFFQQLGHVTTFTYDALNNLRTMAPPDDLVPGTSNPFKLVEIRYENNDHPTSPTSIIEPADGYGNFEAVTTIDYYGANEFTGSDPDDWNGQVYRVTGPNGVVTEYEYDEWGQQSRETENPPDPLAQTTLAFWPTISVGSVLNAGGIVIEGESAQRDKPNCNWATLTRPMVYWRRSPRRIRRVRARRGCSNTTFATGWSTKCAARR